MSIRPSVLIIDDDPHVLDVLNRVLKSNFVIQTASSGPEGLQCVHRAAPDVILLDLIMPQMSGMMVLQRLQDTGKDIPVIILTAYGGVESAVQAIKCGASDFIEKPIDNTKLKQVISTVLTEKPSIQDIPSRQYIIGNSPQIQAVWRMVEQYGPTDLPILLYGETGTGKEYFAKAIHEISKRNRGPYVPVDCSALPESLMESEIFGYEKGAFTGATTSKSGRLAWANEGTLFLDEIGNLPLSYQGKLLRILEEQRYIPLGARKAQTFDVRFISACNMDLEHAIQQNLFRADLYYRIAGVTIELPPLRKRDGDIPLLVNHFVRTYSRKYNCTIAGISDAAIEQLLAYRWPGNIRELEHVIASAVITADTFIRPANIMPHLRSECPDSGDGDDMVFSFNYRCDISQPIDLKGLNQTILAEAEKCIIAEVKKKLLLNHGELARFLNIDPKTLRSKMKRC